MNEWTSEKFAERVGRLPVDDDLERVNCPNAGRVGHEGCGVCKVHDRPVFECRECIAFRADKPGA